MDKIVFSSLIAFNWLLISHCDNLSTHHYHVTYHPCFDTQFHNSQTVDATIFLCCCHVFQEKAKAIDLPFCTKEISKKITSKLFWIDKDWVDKKSQHDVCLFLQITSDCMGTEYCKPRAFAKRLLYSQGIYSLLFSYN